MLPWPNRVQAALALPLQQWATSSAVFCLETIGYEVLQEGNIIHIGQASVAVAEACNGLRMITAFFVISGLVVLLVEQAWWEKLVVFASSLPIALFCNTVRLAITAIAFTVLEGEYWEKVFHDFGGYAMMPLALAIIVGEFWFLAKLTMAPKENTIVVIKGGK
jgi:exosortase